MHQRQEIIQSMLEDLEKAKDLIDDTLIKFDLLKDSVDWTPYVHNTEAAIFQITELEADLFDIEPTLTNVDHDPSLAPFDLDYVFPFLLGQDSEVRKGAIQIFKIYMTDEVVAQFDAACEAGTAFDFAQMWWDQQKKPFVPALQAYRNLKHDRRSVRYVNARALEKKFGVKIWNDEKEDVDLEVAARWLESWLKG